MANRYNPKYNQGALSQQGKAAKKDSSLEKEKAADFPLGRNNFILMAIAGAMIVVGFLLMLGGSSTEEAFNPDIFSTRRIVVGPTIAFLGFLFMGYGIIRKPSAAAQSNKETGDAESAEEK